MLNATAEHTDETSVVESETGASLILARDSSKREPFALFEEYMLLDDTPEYPMDPVFVLNFSERLDWTLARHALLETIERHPMLRRRAHRGFARLFWVPTRRAPEIEYIDADENPDAFNASGFPNVRRLDLYSEPGLRVCYYESKRENRSRLLLQFHHAVSDGMGILAFINDWSTLYSQSVGGLPSETRLPGVNEETLKERYQIGWNRRAYYRNYWHTWRSTRRFAFRFPRPLIPTPPFSKMGLEKEYPFARTLTLSSEETARYIQLAKKSGVTVNDALLCDYFLALDEWLRKVKGDARRGLLRVMAPINMRTSRHEGSPLANIVSTVFLNRSRQALTRGREAVLKSIAEEMRWVKEKEQRYDFLLILKALHTFPGLLTMFLKMAVCRTSAVLSNLGRILDASPVPRDSEGRLLLGTARLDGIDATSPIRYKTSLAIVALTYAGRLSLTARYDARLIPDEEARAFMEIYHSFISGSASLT